MAGLENDRPLSVSTYPVAWRIEIVNEEIHRGLEYVRSEHKIAPPPGTAHSSDVLAFIGELRISFGI